MSKIVLAERKVAPAVPAASQVVLYAKTDSKIYHLDDANIEHGVGVPLAAGTQTANQAVLVISNSNRLTFGMSNSSVVTASPSILISVSAGTSNAAATQVVFSNSNGISFGDNGATITAKMPYNSYFNNGNVEIKPTLISGIPTFQRIPIFCAISATRANVLLAISTLVTNSASSVAGTVGITMGLYTMSASTASLASSATRSIAWNSTLGGASSFTNVSGNRFWSVGLGTWNVTPGDYLFAIMQTSSTSITNQNLVFGGITNEASLIGAEYNTSNLVDYFGPIGRYSASAQTNLPNSVQISDISYISGTVPRAIWFEMVGTF